MNAGASGPAKAGTNRAISQGAMNSRTIHLYL